MCPCERPKFARGLCRRCYYRMKQDSTDPKDIYIYHIKPAERHAAKWAAMTPEQREADVQKQRNRRIRKMELLNIIVPNVCALASLSPCQQSSNQGLLNQDHNHSCACGNKTGCQECFRGLLCSYHNLSVIPMIEKFNEKHIPQLIKEYLAARPLKGTDVYPF